MHVLKRNLKVSGWFLVAIAVVDLTITFFMYHHTHSFVQSASRAQANIIKMIERSDAYYPVFRFQDSKGDAHEIYSSVGQNPPAYKVGDKVTVLYREDKPENAEIDGFWSLWFMPLLIGFFAVIELIVAFGLFLTLFFIQRYEHKRTVVHAA